MALKERIFDALVVTQIRKKHEFEKHGFSYELSGLCGTLFQSSWPSIESFEYLYNSSPLSKFKRNHSSQKLLRSSKKLYFN